MAAAKAAGVAAHLQFAQGDAAAWVPPVPPAVVVTNPPWGERLQADDEQLTASWRALGTFLHARCAGANAYVLCGNAELTRHLGLRASRKWPLWNGPIECRLLRYEIRAD